VTQRSFSLNGVGHPGVEQKVRDGEDALCLNVSSYKVDVWEALLAAY